MNPRWQQRTDNGERATGRQFASIARPCGGCCTADAVVVLPVRVRRLSATDRNPVAGRAASTRQLPARPFDVTQRGDSLTTQRAHELGENYISLHCVTSTTLSIARHGPGDRTKIRRGCWLIRSRRKAPVERVRQGFGETSGQRTQASRTGSAPSARRRADRMCPRSAKHGAVSSYFLRFPARNALRAPVHEPADTLGTRR